MNIEFTMERSRGRDGRRAARRQDAAPNSSRIPRISRLMALAIRFETRIREGDVPDQATLARHGSVSRARLTQIMYLLHLAPDIQEQLLFLSADSRLVERNIRPVADLVHWPDQRKLLARIQTGTLAPQCAPRLDGRV